MLGPVSRCTPARVLCRHAKAAQFPAACLRKTFPPAREIPLLMVQASYADSLSRIACNALYGHCQSG